MKTAVEWIVEQIKSNWHDIEYSDIDIDDLLEQAKEMEKEHRKQVVRGIYLDLKKYYNLLAKTEEKAAHEYASISYTGKQDLYDGFLAGVKWCKEYLYKQEVL